jgi:hypothetical protein
MHSPKTLVEGVLKLAHQATDLDTGTFKASTTTVILYVVRLASRFENYVSFLIQYDAGSHDSIRGKPFRQLGVPARVREQLVAARMSLRKVLLEELRPLLSGWYHKLSRELDTALVEEDDEILDENVRHMCVVHSHLVLMLRNVTAAELCEPLVRAVRRAQVIQPCVSSAMRLRRATQLARKPIELAREEPEVRRAAGRVRLSRRDRARVQGVQRLQQRSDRLHRPRGHA